MKEEKGHKDHRIKGQWLPTTRKEMEHLGWEQADVILFTGDAYIDHPSMGTAVIGRVLEAHGYKVAVVPQPNWRDDLRDFKKLGRPRLFFGVSAGAMDSMVNHYTAARRKRSDDAYTPDGRAGARPDYPTIVYSEILKRLFPDVPVVAGGIEVSLRRLAHYDYWQDRLRPSILVDCPADLLVYGMGELPNIAIADALAAGRHIEELTDIPQTVVRRPLSEMPAGDSDTDVVLHSYKECQQSKKCQAENFKIIEVESNLWHGHNVWQATGDIAVKVNRTNPPMTTQQIDASFDLPYTRLPHPRYQGKRIPAGAALAAVPSAPSALTRASSSLRAARSPSCEKSSRWCRWKTSRATSATWAVPVPTCTVCTAKTWNAASVANGHRACTPTRAAI